MAGAKNSSDYLQELARFRRQFAHEGAPTEMLEAIDTLNARRMAEYGDDPRCVGEWDLLPDGLRGYKFPCDARLPSGGTMHCCADA